MPRKREGEFRECLNCKKQIYITKLDVEKTKKGISSRRSSGKYCSNQCQADHTWKEKKAKVLKYGIETLGSQSNASQDRILKQIVIEEFGRGKTGRACWECGWEEENLFIKGRGFRKSNIPTQLNHKDGNPNNQSIDNLEIICPNCHALTPFYGSRGKGGRKDSKGNRIIRR